MAIRITISWDCSGNPGEAPGCIGRSWENGRSLYWEIIFMLSFRGENDKFSCLKKQGWGEYNVK